MAAESVGLAASVAGIVSLGLQVTGGIIKYVDAFENRQEELKFVKQQSEILKTVLGALGTHLMSQGHSGAVSDAVVQSMQFFHQELLQVQALHADLVDCDPQSWKSRVNNTKKKITYAFHRSKIQELGLQLQKAGNVLQLSLSVLGLKVQGQNTKTLAAVESSSQNISSDLSLVRSEVAAYGTPVIKIQDELSLLRGEVDSKSQRVVSQYEYLLNHMHGSRNDVLRGLQETTEHWIQLQSIREQQMTKRHDERLDGLAATMTVGFGKILEHLQQSGAQIPARETVVCGLAGKPAFLKKLSDEAQLSRQTYDRVMKPDLYTPPLQDTARPSTRHYASKPNTGKICICPRLQSATKNKWLKLGHASFFQEMGTTAHWPSCPMAKMRHKQQRSLGLKYNGLVRILKTAITVSFTLTSGAGGFSISPNFTCSPTVDENFDPAFRIVSLIGEGLLMLEGGNPEPFLKACTTRLSRLLDDRKVCATAVDRRNMGLMHYLIMADVYHVAKDRGAINNLFVDLVRMLLSYGVPAFALDLEGLSPLMGLSFWFFGDDISRAVIDVLIQGNSENQPLMLNPDREYEGYRHDQVSVFSVPTITINSLYKVSPGFAEVSECGPLSMAITHNDADGVEHMLNRFPDLITEIDVFGQTPFHLAAVNPPILEILLRHRNDSILDQRDVSGFTALEIAMIQTAARCDNGWTIESCDANECGCCRCVDLFIGAECGVRIHELEESDRAPELGILLAEASELARRKYISYMKRQRNSAIRSPNTSPHALTKSKSVHSSTKPEVGRLENDITGSDQVCESISSSDLADEMSWTFLEINDTDFGNLLYRHGFRPRPSSFNHLRQDLSSSKGNSFYIHWLASHGVDLFLRSSKGPALSKDSPNVGLFGAHFAFYLFSLRPNPLGLSDYSTKTKPWDKHMALIETVCRQNLTDGCECHCTMDGCSPFTWMMKRSHFMSQFDGLEMRDVNIKSLTSNYMDFYNRCDVELTLLTYKAAIRYATFEALGLIHTCCNSRHVVYHDEQWMDRDDADIVNEEQAILLEAFEALVEDFEEEAVRFMEVGSSGNSPFRLFWDFYWKRRIEEEVEKLEGNELTDAERRGAEEIGIQWAVSSPQHEVEEGNLYRVGDPEHWFYKLDQICPEYADPWPEQLRQVSELP